MIITVINDDNVRFFYEAIGERYDQRKNNETYVGLVNDDDRAVGAAILTAGSGSMLLSYIGIEDESQRQGLGSMFIDEIIDSIDRTMFDRLKAILFLKDTDKNGPIPAFLKSNVFMERPSYSRRTRYDLKMIMEMAASADRRRFDNGTVVRAENLSDPQREMIYETDDILYEDKDAYFDAERILSDDNRFGGIYIKDDRVVAALCASPFEDGKEIKLEKLSLDEVRAKKHEAESSRIRSLRAEKAEHEREKARLDKELKGLQISEERKAELASRKTIHLTHLKGVQAGYIPKDSISMISIPPGGMP